jgi:hypothetical protein
LSSSAVSIDDLWEDAASRLRRLVSQIGRRQPATLAFGELFGVLAALPLSTSEFCQASNRLQNAERYHAAAEWGAAGYELQLLERGLERLADSQRDGTPAPRRRATRPARSA